MVFSSPMLSCNFVTSLNINYWFLLVKTVPVDCVWYKLSTEKKINVVIGQRMRKKLKVVITNHCIYSPQMIRLQETHGINGLKKYISNSQQILICCSLAREMSTCSWYSRNCFVTHEMLTIILFISPVNMSDTTKFISLSRLDVSELSWVPSWLLLVQLQLDLISSFFTNFWDWERIYFH